MSVFKRTPGQAAEDVTKNFDQLSGSAHHVGDEFDRLRVKLRDIGGSSRYGLQGDVGRPTDVPGPRDYRDDGFPRRRGVPAHDSPDGPRRSDAEWERVFGDRWASRIGGAPGHVLREGMRAARTAGNLAEAAGLDSAAVGAVARGAGMAAAGATVAIEVGKAVVKVTQDVAAQIAKETNTFYSTGGSPAASGRAYGVFGDNAGARSQALGEALRGDTYGAAWARGRGITDLGDLQSDKATNVSHVMRELRKVPDINERIRIGRGLGIEDELWQTDLSQERADRMETARGSIGTPEGRKANAEYRASLRTLEGKWAGIVAEKGTPLVDSAARIMGAASGDKNDLRDILNDGIANSGPGIVGKLGRATFGLPARWGMEQMANAYGGNTAFGRWIRDPKGGREWVGIADLNIKDAPGQTGPGEVKGPPLPAARWRTDVPREAQRMTRAETINGTTEGALPRGWNGKQMQDQGAMTAGPRGNSQNAALDWMAGMLGAGAV